MFKEQVALAQIGDFFGNIWNAISEFFISTQWDEVLFDVKLIFIVISTILLFLIIFLLIKISIIAPLHKVLFEHAKPRDPILSKKKIQKRWNKIEARARSGLEANYKLAIIEADKLFDRVLKNIGYEMGKKLFVIDEIKAASKIKDKIIKDKYRPSKQESERAIAAYRKGLEELDVL